MRKIEKTKKFQKDIKREARGLYRAVLETDLRAVLDALAIDQELAKHLHDHDLSGNWKGHRECHIKPDLLLIYAKPDDETLRLERLGSHSELDI